MGPVLTQQRGLAPSWSLAVPSQGLARPCLVRADEVVPAAIPDLGAAMLGAGGAGRANTPLGRPGPGPGGWGGPELPADPRGTAAGRRGEGCWAWACPELPSSRQPGTRGKPRLGWAETWGWVLCCHTNIWGGESLRTLRSGPGHFSPAWFSFLQPCVKAWVLSESGFSRGQWCWDQEAFGKRSKLKRKHSANRYKFCS